MTIISNSLVKLNKYIHHNLISLILIMLKLYQICVSPFLGNSCRFHPTCSNYAIKAYASLGLIRGTFLTFKRVVKCHPFHPGGIDELTESGDIRKHQGSQI